MMGKKKTKRVSELQATKLRVHNLEVALVALSSVLQAAAGPTTATNLDAVAVHLFECNSTWGGFTEAQMLARGVTDAVVEGR
jgi:hypothetical protein